MSIGAVSTRSRDTVSRLEERIAILERQLSAVHLVSSALFSKTDLDSTLAEGLHVALDTVHADAGSILLVADEKNALVFCHVIGKTELIGREIATDDEQSQAAAVYRTGKSLVSDDARRDGYNPTFDEATGFRTASICTVPLTNLGGEPIGVMQLLNKRAGSFDSRDLELLEIVSTLLATAIENARLADKERLAAVGRAVGDLGHDIKNALTPIETAIDTMLGAVVEPALDELAGLADGLDHRDPDTSGKIKTSVQRLRDECPFVHESVKDGCADIRELVGEIADYTKGWTAINRQSVNLREVIGERLRRLRMIARDRRIDLRIDGFDDMPPCSVDRRLVGRAVYNLVYNAMSAMDAAVKQKQIALRDFTIQVRGRAVSEGAFPDGHFCEIEVSDDGPGIPDHVKALLFTERAISTTPGGTGIGTRFVQGVAEAHGGHVGVESEPGNGARFRMRLPLD